MLQNTSSPWLVTITTFQYTHARCSIREWLRVLKTCPRAFLKSAIHSQLNWAILLCGVIPDGKTEWTAQFRQGIAQASELYFPVVFHTENWAVHSGDSTVSSVYLPTPRWHHVKALNSFSRWVSHDIFLFKYHFLLIILRFVFFFSDNVMADVASKQQTTVLFLSTTVTRTRKHTKLTKKKPRNLMGNLCCAREHLVQFFMQFFI